MTEDERKLYGLWDGKCKWCATKLPEPSASGARRKYCDTRCRDKARKRRARQEREHPGLSASEIGRLNVMKRWQGRLR